MLAAGQWLQFLSVQPASGAASWHGSWLLPQQVTQGAEWKLQCSNVLASEVTCCHIHHFLLVTWDLPWISMGGGIKRCEYQGMEIAGKHL